MVKDKARISQLLHVASSLKGADGWSGDGQGQGMELSTTARSSVFFSSVELGSAEGR